MWSIGCDPEIFLQKDSKPMSAIGTVGGTKHTPKPMMEIGEGFGIQEDNMAVEFNIPPASNKDVFINSINLALKGVQSRINEYDAFISTHSAVFFDPDDIAHPMAQQFGCDPDYNAWEQGKMNPRPKPVDHHLRAAGGHIHVGYSFKSREEILAFIRRCDLFLGVPSVLLDKEGTLRKKSGYGKPGAFRFKSYGCEYRTLSNFWIFDPKLVSWVYDNTQRALESQMDIDFCSDIPEIINTANTNKALDLIKLFNIPLQS